MTSTPARRSAPVRDERGLSVSIFVAVLIPLFIIIAGLVVDSASRAAAARNATVVAAQAARAGSDASAADRLTGGTGASAAVASARSVLTSHGVSGEVSVRNGQLQVHTTARSTTLFLGLVGIDHFDVAGDATSSLVRV